MRRKINDAFRRPTKTVKSHIDDDRASVNSGGSETEVDEEGKCLILNFKKVVIFNMKAY